MVSMIMQESFVKVCAEIGNCDNNFHFILSLQIPVLYLPVVVMVMSG